MGEAKLYGKSASGMKIDGIIVSYPVYTGQTISAGDFVEIVDGTVRKATTQNFNGVAKNSGTSGTSVNVYVNPAWYWQFNLIENGDFESGVDGWSGWHSNYVTFTQDSNGLIGNCAKFTITTPYSGDGNTASRYSVEMTEGHIYYARVYIKGISSNYAIMAPRMALRDMVNGTSINLGNYVASNVETWQKASAYGTSTSTGTNELRLMMLMGDSNGNITSGMAIYYDEVKVYDLTTLFGAGNEPDKATCDKYL